MAKRQDYLSWDEYFMGIACISALRSKDPSTQVGCCIVSDQNRIATVGYNGMPSGCSDDEYPWAREGQELDTKYLYVCHAELNAILSYIGGSLQGFKVYTTLFPCNECTKALIQKGIQEIVYMEDKYPDSPSVVAAKRMLVSAGVAYRQYVPADKTVTLKL